jgi:hypothetical protein
MVVNVEAQGRVGLFGSVVVSHLARVAIRLPPELIERTSRWAPHRIELTRLFPPTSSVPNAIIQHLQFSDTGKLDVPHGAREHNGSVFVQTDYGD